MNEAISDTQWQATAAYLYMLTLPAAGLAWEYLRRNTRYQDDWRHRRLSDGVGHFWGLDRHRKS